MAATALSDFDRLANGLASGNVVTGVNTGSGNFGKDILGTAPNRVTQIQFGTNVSAVDADGTDIAGVFGTLHIDQDGSYSYTRLPGTIGTVPIGATDTFSYALSDKSGVSNIATLTISVLPETVAPPDDGGLHRGSAFDDYIDASGYGFVQSEGRVVVDGGVGQDFITAGTAAEVRFLGGAGDDALLGSGGDDILEGGAGADLLNGFLGYDTAGYGSSKAAVNVNLEAFFASGGDAAGDHLVLIDGLIGSAFNDTLRGNGVDNELDGGKGNDTIAGGGGDDNLAGGVGNDVLDGGDDWDYLVGGAGSDTLIGGTGFDIAAYSSSTSGVLLNLGSPGKSSGEARNDTYQSIEGFFGSAFNDTMIGAAGNDGLYGAEGADRLEGGKGNDELLGGSGNDIAHGGDGDDSFDGGGDADTLNGEAGEDTIAGSDGNDVLNGGGDNDTLEGEDGNDTLLGGAGNDMLFGKDSNDALTGGDGNDQLYGDIGSDALKGGAGNDFLYGGVGIDRATGGAGVDTFHFAVAEFGLADIVTDFKLGEDRLQLGGVINGAGDTLQDLLDAGLNAVSSGTTLSILRGDQVVIAMNGWTGPQITSMQDLYLTLGSSLEVL